MLAASQGVIFALCGASVRIQFALFRGFDFICAVAVLAAAESVVWGSRIAVGPQWVRAASAAALSLAVAVSVVAAWNFLLDRSFRLRSELGGALLIFSLGVSMAAAGLVTLTRGPGLRQATLASANGSGPAANPTLYALVAGTAAMLLTFTWTRARRGFALDLWSQDAAFAREIGIERRALAVGNGLAGGMCLGVVGSYFALAGGSTPEIGLPAFLYGAASALLLPGDTIGRSMLGGLVLGPVFVALQLVSAPAVANSILFVLTLILLLVRGTSRSAQHVR